jgi:hypothetical protein
MIAQLERDLSVRFEPALYEAPAQKPIQRKRCKSRFIPDEDVAHCELLAALLLKLAKIHNLPSDEINPLTIYRVLKRYDLTCELTGIAHSQATPLTLRFVSPIEQGGIRPQNLAPFYEPAGHITRGEFMTPCGVLIGLTEQDERPRYSCTFTIYRLLNTVTGNSYVGCTALKPKKRRSGHFNKLANGKHCNNKLQASFDRFGMEAFEFQVLETGLSAEDAPGREIFWIEHFGSYSDGYNATVDGRSFRG